MTRLVEDGSIRIVELQAVPRSMSTALGRCLNESDAPSVFIHEPFNIVRSDVDTTAAHVIGLVQDVLPSAQEPVTVFTKNISRFLSPSIFRRWTDVCSAVLWCVRDPRVQMASLVTRIANDVTFGYGAHRLKQDELLPSHLAMATEFLQSGSWSTGFSMTSWRAIGSHFTDFARDIPSLVADGALFTDDSERFVRHLCRALDIKFCDRMIDGWGRPFLIPDPFDNPNLADTDDGWVMDAVASRGVNRADRTGLDLSALPVALREHLADVAIPTYEMFMRVLASQYEPFRPIAGTDEAG